MSYYQGDHEENGDFEKIAVKWRPYWRRIERVCGIAEWWRNAAIIGWIVAAILAIMLACGRIPLTADHSPLVSGDHSREFTLSGGKPSSLPPATALQALPQTTTPNTRTVFAAEHDPVFEAKVDAAASFIRQSNPHIDADLRARQYVTASREAGMPPPGNFWLIVAIAQFESTHYECMNPDRSAKPDCVGRAGERGPLQILPSAHFANMRKAGLNPADVDDLILWGATIIAGNLQRGDTVGHATRRWTCSADATALFYKLTSRRIEL